MSYEPNYSEEGEVVISISQDLGLWTEDEIGEAQECAQTEYETPSKHDKGYKCSWSDEQTLLLLTTLEDFKGILHIGYKKREILKKVVEVFRERGYAHTFVDMKRKWSNMLQRFRRVRSQNKSTGEARASWKFYAQMHTLTEKVEAQPMPHQYAESILPRVPPAASSTDIPQHAQTNCSAMSISGVHTGTPPTNLPLSPLPHSTTHINLQNTTIHITPPQLNPLPFAQANISTNPSTTKPIKKFKKASSDTESNTQERNNKKEAIDSLVSSNKENTNILYSIDNKLGVLIQTLNKVVQNQINTNQMLSNLRGDMNWSANHATSSLPTISQDIGRLATSLEELVSKKK